jgi:hypothetical protein
VIIVGTARSGTSWLSETIASQHRYRILFEPEHETRTKKGHLLCDQWIANINDSRKANYYLKQVFANRVDCDWIAQSSNRKFKMHLLPFIPKKYIIKFVRANLLAKHMNENFEIPVIHMIRNPYDVLHSQLRANFPWLVDMKLFVGQTNLVKLIKDFSGINIEEYQSFSKLQILTLRWCIENVIPLELLEPYQYKHQIVRYEDLYKDINYFYKLCETFDLTQIKGVEDLYRSPSTKTHKNSSIVTMADKRVFFNTDEFAKINQILDAFQTRLYPRRH